MRRPVFIIGAGRSGTKLLRDLLATSVDVSAIPYDVNFIWRHGNERLSHDALAAQAATERVTNDIRRSLARLAGRPATAGAMMLEKTVSNALRVPFVSRVYPEGRFIHLLRDGRDVTESALRMWQSKPELIYLLRKARHFPWRNYRYAAWFLRNTLSGANRGARVWGPRYPEMESDLATLSLQEVCAKQWAACVLASFDAFDKLSVPVKEVRYEDLVADEAVLTDICRDLELSDSAVVMESYRQRVRSDAVGKGARSLADDVLEKIAPLLAPAMERAGYAAAGSHAGCAERKCASGGQ